MSATSVNFRYDTRAGTHTVASHFYSSSLSPSIFFFSFFLLLLLPSPYSPSPSPFSPFPSPSPPSSVSFFHLLLQEDKSEEAAMNEEGHGAEDKDADDKHAADSASTELAEMAAVHAVTRSSAVQVRLLHI